MKLKNALTTYLQTQPLGIPEFIIAAGVEQPGVRTFDVVNNAIVDSVTNHPEMTIQRALALTTEIDFLAVADHVDVKGDPDWLHLYRIGPGTLPYIDPNGARKMRKLNQTVACDACGVLLGMDHIQVDHQHPQVGGATMAICKVFRALGCTVGTPIGNKIRNLRHEFTQTAFQTVRGPYALNLRKNPNNVAITNQYASRNFNAIPGSVNRYTLTNEGNVLLSLMRADPTLNANFDRKCLDSFANLKPLCAPCNNNKGNTLKYV